MSEGRNNLSPSSCDGAALPSCFQTVARPAYHKFCRATSIADYPFSFIWLRCHSQGLPSFVKNGQDLKQTWLFIKSILLSQWEVSLRNCTEIRSVRLMQRKTTCETRSEKTVAQAAVCNVVNYMKKINNYFPLSEWVGVVCTVHNRMCACVSVCEFRINCHFYFEFMLKDILWALLISLNQANFSATRF